MKKDISRGPGGQQLNPNLPKLIPSSMKVGHHNHNKYARIGGSKNPMFMGKTLTIGKHKSLNLSYLNRQKMGNTFY